MSTQLVLVGSPLVPCHDEIRAKLVRAGLRDSSIRRYLGAARSWEQYCADHEEHPGNASTMALVRWLDARCRVSNSPVSAIRIALAAARFVQRAHALADGSDPMPYTRNARAALDAYCRSATLQRAPKRRARPMRLDTLARLVAHVRASVHPRASTTWEQARYLAARDAALLLAGWWGALRADDLAQLTWADVIISSAGVLFALQTSKTGPAQVACASLAHRGLCPRHALEELASYSRDQRAFGLATGYQVARRIKTVCQQHGAAGYTSHSLRSGFATECASQNVPDKLVQLHARWASAQQHAEYVREGRLWLDTPTARLALPLAPELGQ